MQGGEEAVEGDDCLIRVRGAGKLMEQFRNDVGELLTGKLPLQRVVRRRAPAPNPRQIFRAVGESPLR